MQVRLGREVDPAPEEPLEPFLELHPPQHARRVRKLDEQVEVAPGSGFAAGDRSEHAELGRSEFARQREESIPVGT
jgi:hypothetical protein